MMFHRELAVGLLDVLFGSVAAQSQCRVVIPLRHDSNRPLIACAARPIDLSPCRFQNGQGRIKGPRQATPRIRPDSTSREPAAIGVRYRATGYRYLSLTS